MFPVVRLLQLAIINSERKALSIITRIAVLHITNRNLTQRCVYCRYRIENRTSPHWQMGTTMILFPHNCSNKQFLPRAPSNCPVKTNNELDEYLILNYLMMARWKTSEFTISKSNFIAHFCQKDQYRNIEISKRVEHQLIEERCLVLEGLSRGNALQYITTVVDTALSPKFRILEEIPSEGRSADWKVEVTRYRKLIHAFGKIPSSQYNIFY